MFKQMQTGDSVPWFVAPTLDGSSEYMFQTAAGRHILLMFAGTAALPQTTAALRLVQQRRSLFDDKRACFFGVTSDPADAAEGRIARQIPGIRWFLDYDRAVARRYGVFGEAGYAPCWLLIDPRLRVLAHVPLNQGEQILDRLAALVEQPPLDEAAPVLTVPNVFDADLCRRLIALYEERGGEPTGFMNNVGGVTTAVVNESTKRRSDYFLPAEEPLREAIRQRLVAALLPQISLYFQFQATRVERYVVACYDSEGGGFFRPHRDNSLNGTAHRRFACSINLNAEEHEGGDLRFPEFGPRLYRPQTGGAVVFSCSLMHEATPVTRGKRYACLPFFYDEAAARQREKAAKAGLVHEDLSSYRA